jgi:hypothetical protein
MMIAARVKAACVTNAMGDMKQKGALISGREESDTPMLLGENH